MSDNTIAEPSRAPTTNQQGLSGGLFVAFFLGEGGYFLAYGSLCSTVPIVATLDQFVPFILAGLWGGAIYLGLSRSPRFYRYVRTVALVSIAYGAANIVMGPFTFRVGPANVDPATLTCGRWPRDVTQAPGLEVLQLDWLNMPISIFGLSMVLVCLGIFVFARVSKRVAAIYKPAS